MFSDVILWALAGVGAFGIVVLGIDFLSKLQTKNARQKKTRGKYKTKPERLPRRLGRD